MSGLNVVLSCIAHDDLLKLAAGVEFDIQIERDRGLGAGGDADASVFERARVRYVDRLDDDNRAIRVDARRALARIAAFEQLRGTPTVERPSRLQQAAIDDLEQSSTPDEQLLIIMRADLARYLRLEGEHQRAIEAAKSAELTGTGATHAQPLLEAERIKALLVQGEADAAARMLERTEGSWTTARHSITYPDRLFAEALVSASTGQLPRAESAIREAIDFERPDIDLALDSAATDKIALALAYLKVAEAGGTNPTAAAGALLNDLALLRSRWRVAGRSRSPLADALRRCYGDVIEILSRTPDNEVGRLGFQAAADIKHSGLAEMIRHDLPSVGAALGRVVKNTISTLDRHEADQRSAGRAAPLEPHPQVEDEKAERIARLDLIAERVSKVFAEWVSPEPVDVPSYVDHLDGVLLDYLELPTTAGDVCSVCIFRLRNGSSGMTPQPRAPSMALLKRWTGWLDSRPGSLEVWSGTVARLIPDEVWADLDAAPGPTDLTMSPFGSLTYVPWAAVRSPASKRRLVDLAVLRLTPAFSMGSVSSLHDGAPSSALVRLIEDPEQGLDTTAEKRAWSAAESLLTVHRAQAGEFAALLSSRLDIAHVAAHGSGSGLAQTVGLPELLNAAEALGLDWPKVVVFAACHVGGTEVLTDGEVFGMVTSCLARGAAAVIGGIGAIPDAHSGQLAAQLVPALCAGARPAVALRNAQLAMLAGDEVLAPRHWALLVPFVAVG